MTEPFILSNSVYCPECRADLLPNQIGWHQPVLCAACGARFVLRPPGFNERTSRKAILSMILGIGSLIFFCWAGIPAIVFGSLALADIRRSQGGLAGRRLALAGIVTGIVCGFLLAPITLALVVPAIQMLRSSKDSSRPPEAGESSERFEFANGLKVILRPVQKTPHAAIAVLYSIGGDHDPEGMSGLAHLIEHLYVTAPAGSVGARTADAFMSKYPAGWNAQTSDRFTVIATVFPRESLESELQEAAARMSDLRVTEADLARETPRLIEEVQNMFGGHPPLVAYNHARELLRPTPLGGRKGGRPEHVSQLSLATVQQRIRRFYRPKNATLVVVGAIDQAATHTMVTKYFASLDGGELIPEAHSPAISQRSGEIVTVPAKPFAPGATDELCVAYQAPQRDDEHFAVFLVLAARLAGQASKLDRTPNRFPIDYSPIFDGSTLFVTIPVQAGESAEQALARVDHYVAETIEMPLTATDRFVARSRYAIDLRAMELPDATLAQNLYFVAFSTARRAMLDLESLDAGKVIGAVTDEQMRRAAQDIFTSERRVVVVADAP